MSHGDYSLYEPREMMEENKDALSDDISPVHCHSPIQPSAVPEPGQVKHHDRPRPKTTGQDPLGHRRPAARGDERGRLPRLHAVVPVPALPLGQLRGGGEEGTGAGLSRRRRDGDGRKTPLARLVCQTTPTTWRISRSRCAARCITSSSPNHLWASIANLARTQNGELLNTLQEGFKYIENESFQSTFQGLFSEINLGSDKLGKNYADRNAKLCTIIQKIAEGLAQFSTDIDTLGDAYEYLIGQFAAGSGKKAGEFYTPQQISSILSAIVTLDSQEPKTGKRKRLESVLDFACGSGSLLLNVRKRMGPHGHRQDFRAGKEHHHLQPGAHEHAAARGEGHGVRNLPRRHADQRLGHAARDEPGQEAAVRRRRRQSAVQLPLGAERGDGRGRALQEPRPGAQDPPPTSPSCCTASIT